MKKNIYKSTITIMLCLLFFMQKDILADNPTTCASTSIYHDTVLSKPTIPQYGILGLLFKVKLASSSNSTSINCWYAYDENSNCVNGSTCNLQLIPINDLRCIDNRDCCPDHARCPYSTKLCPTQFTSTKNSSDTAWTFQVGDIADNLVSASNTRLQAVIWDPSAQPEISTMMYYQPLMVQDNKQMPTIQLAYDTKSKQQITMQDNTDDNRGLCDYDCRTDECNQKINFSNVPATPNSIKVKTTTTDSTGTSQSCLYNYSNNGLTPTDSGNKCINHPHSTTNPNDPLQAIKLPLANYTSIAISSDRAATLTTSGNISPIIITSSPSDINYPRINVALMPPAPSTTRNTQDASR